MKTSVGILIVAGGVVLASVVGWVLTHAVIYSVRELFGVDWSGKFLAVYLLLVVISVIFGRVHK